MIPEHWLYVSVLLLVATNLATVAYVLAVRERAGGTETVDSGADRADSGAERSSAAGGRATPDRAALAGNDADGDAATCTECGAENDPDYRYCRRCAAELPGVWVGGSGVSGLPGRGVE